jgi:hypothetical protein
MTSQNKPNSKAKPSSTKKVTKTLKASKPIVAYPDSWSVEEEKGDLVLVFYRMENPIMKIDVTPSTMGDIIKTLNEIIIVDDQMADSWSIRNPDDPTLPSFLSIMKSGKLLGTLPLDKKDGLKMLNQMSQFKPNYNPKNLIIDWAKKHKILSGLFLAIFIPSFGYTLYSIVLNIITTV